MNTNDKLIRDFLAHLKIPSPTQDQIEFLRMLPEEDMIKPVAYALYQKGKKLTMAAKIYGFKPHDLYYRMKCIFESMGKKVEEEQEEKAEI